ncbi:DUF3455 domain-containing protein, partial [Acinetobacter baumannii]
GTQNYTCDVSKPSELPVQTGALATLFNASCIAAAYPEVLALIPKVSMSFNLDKIPSRYLAPTQMAISGHHFFPDPKTPYF